MRVAVVSESFLPTVNGVTNSVLRVLDNLAASGHEAIVICPDAGAPADYAGFRIHQVPSFAYRQFPVGLPSPQVQRILAKFGPDVLHAASPFLLGAQAIAAANRLGVPSVAIYQTDVAGFARRNGLGMTSAIAWKYVRWVHEGANLTLAPSSASEFDLRQAGVSRLARWGRGVDLERYHPDNRARRRRSPCAAAVTGRARRSWATSAASRPRSSWSGSGAARHPRSLDRDRRRRPGESGGGARAARDERHLLGRLGGADLATAYAALDVFVHTGSEETFGQTVQEAHASGLPVIAPRAGGPVDLVDHGGNGLLFRPGDDRALRAAVAMLAQDAPLRMRMGETGRRAVLGRGWDALCAELVGHYERVILDAAASVQPASTQRAYS